MSEPFDFDFWLRAYQEDPDGFEELQKAHIFDYIDNMGISEEKKNILKGLYWRVSADPRVTGTKNGLVRAARAQNLMIEKLQKLNLAWKGVFDDEE